MNLSAILAEKGDQVISVPPEALVSEVGTCHLLTRTE